MIHCLAHLDVMPSVARFWDCANTRPLGLGKWDDTRAVRDQMRSLVPADGPITKDIQVTVSHGRDIAEHQHAEWTAILYVDPGEPVCAITIEGQRFEPVPGDVVVLEPGTVHAVERSRSPRRRLSFAILVPDEKYQQKHCLSAPLTT